MFSKILNWLKNPARYMWLKNPLHLTVFVGLLAAIGICSYLALHGLKADESDDPNDIMPQITTFTAPITSDNRDYIITVEANNVANLIQNIGGWGFKQKAACVLYSGTAAYPITATTHNGTAIPRTQIHRIDFINSWGQKTNGMEYAKETITLNCLNYKKADYETKTIQASEKPSAPKVTLISSSTSQANKSINYEWDSHSMGEVCGPTINDAMDDEKAFPSNELFLDISDTSEFVSIFCRNKNESVINFTTGQAVFLMPSQSKWRLEFTAPKEVKPNTNFQVQYQVYDGTGMRQKVGVVCKKSGGWTGETIDGAGTETITGWASGAKTFTLTCLTPGGSIITPISNTVTVIERRLSLTVDGQDLPNNTNYQPPYNSPVALAWQYTGPTTDKCSASSVNASTGKANSSFNGPVAFSGRVNAGTAYQTIRYTLTCATESKTINALFIKEPVTAPPVQPPTTPQLNFTVNPTDYSSVSSTSVYQLKTNKFTASWKLTPNQIGSPCLGSGDIPAWNIRHASTGSQLISNISGKKTLTLTCLNVTKTLTINYTAAPTQNILSMTYTGYDGKTVTANDTNMTQMVMGRTLNKAYTLTWNFTGSQSTQCNLQFTQIGNPNGTLYPVTHTGTYNRYMLYSTEYAKIICGSYIRIISSSTSTGSARLF